jgi:protocatechuate 3,4-dioxygenase beta subunit
LSDVAGENIRKDVRESQKGLTVHLDMQVYDIKTCQPIPKAAVEIWGANATVSSCSSILFGFHADSR